MATGLDDPRARLWQRLGLGQEAGIGKGAPWEGKAFRLNGPRPSLLFPMCRSRLPLSHGNLASPNEDLTSSSWPKEPSHGKIGDLDLRWIYLLEITAERRACRVSVQWPRYGFWIVYCYRRTGLPYIDQQGAKRF
ncbi:hypothetical protein MLD38_021534 [Melastoma candidum]|uniref:Uncharacterized protein n=1 Tax=Melastoma candidum TaxID=119954 RepID=A0ACB9QJ91_9MYRT|nr:hypothetical protein MLD38_021534 [Melastoma candidum]